MFPNFSKLPKLALAILLPIWVFVSFIAAQLIIEAVVWILVKLGAPLSSVNQTVLSAIIAAVLYIITLIIVIGGPLLTQKKATSLKEVGLTNLPTWTDIFMAPAGFVIYFILSSGLIYVATQMFPGFNATQAQNTGFGHVNKTYELILAFITLVVVAPVAEETLFRGYLYGKLKKYIPIWVAILITSALFGSLHGAWNVAVDTFALSIILCLLRESTGGIWASILLHMIKNGIAFYFLFIVGLR